MGILSLEDIARIRHEKLLNLREACIFYSKQFSCSKKDVKEFLENHPQMSIRLSGISYYNKRLKDELEGMFISKVKKYNRPVFYFKCSNYNDYIRNWKWSFSNMYRGNIALRDVESLLVEKIRSSYRFRANLQIREDINSSITILKKIKDLEFRS